MMNDNKDIKRSGMMKNNKVEIVENNGKKYIDGEEILYEYDCWTNWILIRFFLFSFLLIGFIKHYFFTLHQYNFESFFVVGFLALLLIGWGWIDFKTAINRGMYITKNHIITFSGKKIPLEDIYYKWGAGGVGYDYGSAALMLYNNSVLIISCLAKDNNQSYLKLIDILKQISQNDELKKISKTKAKRKLIQTKGENHVR